LRQAELERAAAQARTVEEARTRQMAEAKAVEERKRRHVTLALAAVVLILVTAAGSGACWWVMERSAAEQEVHTALENSAKYGAEGRWPDARTALERVEGRLGTWGFHQLRERVRNARLDAELVADLDEIRLLQSEATWVGLKDFEFAKANASYQAAFDK